MIVVDDEALWKRGKNVEFIVKKLQKAIKNIENRSHSWGF